MRARRPDPWLLLIHQIPPKPDYLRVKAWRRLQRIGAVPIKNSVYALPNTEQAREDVEWVRREIVEDGGDASVCEATFVDGLGDDEVKALFHAARNPDYEAVAADARDLQRRLRSADAGADAATSGARDVTRLKRRMSEIAPLDFFGAPARAAAELLIATIERELKALIGRKKTPHAPRRGAKPHGATWVTRKGIYVDRMASAWLIRRFIDTKARFKFVPAKGYRPGAGELRFDMFDAEYTHDGDACTFEVLLARFEIADSALAALAEIVHDIDLKDGKFAREETAGVEHLLSGIAMANKDDDARLLAATPVWDGLHAYFRKKRA